MEYIKSISDNSDQKVNLIYPGMFDFIKGIAMILIIITHLSGIFPEKSITVSNYPLINSVVQDTVDMFAFGNAIIPMFFLISGFGFRPVKVEKCFKKQSKLLLRPYAISAVFATCLHLCFHYFFFRWLRGSVKATICVAAGYLLGLSRTFVISDWILCSVGAVWYLFTLFISWNILNLIFSRASTEHHRCFIVCILTLAGWIIGSMIPLPFCIPQGLVGTGYLYAGWLIKKNNLFSKKISCWYWGVIIILTLVSEYFGEFSLSDATWKLGLIDIVGPGCMAFIILWIALRINRFEIPLKNSISMIGRYSLWIMCIHTIENQAFPWYIFIDCIKGNHFASFLLLLTVKGMIIYSIYKMLIWWNLKYKRKKKKGAKYV